MRKPFAVVFFLLCLCGFAPAEKIPDNILRMTEIYPETKVLVDYYNEVCGDENYHTREIDISGDLLTDDVPLFLQWDKRWAFLNYGRETVIATSACGPVCLAMVQCYFHKGEAKSPKDMAKFSYEKGFYVEKVGTSGALFLDGAYHFNLKPRVIGVGEDEIKKSLDDGKIIVALVKQGHFTAGGHYIVVKGYDDDGNFLVNDPNSLVNSKKSWPPEVITGESRMLWSVGVN